MTNDTQTQNDEDFDYGCECAMTLLNEPTEDCLNDLIDELDEDGMIATEVVYGLLATILMSITSEDEDDDRGEDQEADALQDTEDESQQVDDTRKRLATAADNENPVQKSPKPKGPARTKKQV
jgi:hypothetical protein